MQSAHRSSIAAFCLCALAIPAMAHHGWAGQQSEQSEISGKVQKPVDLNGPHATMQVLADGKLWDITLAPPPRTRASGLTPDTLKVGDTVTIRGNRNSDPKRFEMKTVRVTAGGKNYDVYPDRIK